MPSTPTSPDGTAAATGVDARVGTGLTLARDGDSAEPAPRLVIVPCGKAKQPESAPAGAMKIGSYHRAAMRAARALAERAPGTMIAIAASAKYGLLVDLDEVIEPYDTTAGRPGAITPVRLRRQAKVLGLAGAEVTVLAGRRYVDLARTVWPTATAPLEGVGGMGLQLQRLARIAADGLDPAASHAPVER